MTALSYGMRVIARRRWGRLRMFTVRLWSVDRRGRPYVIAHDRYDICHRVWVEHITYVERRGTVGPWISSSSPPSPSPNSPSIPTTQGEATLR